MWKYTVLMVIFLLDFSFIIGQQKENDDLLKELERQLFEYEIKDTATIALKELSNCNEMGQVANFRISIYQPNMNKVLDLLEEISWTKDTNLLEPLKDIYLRQVKRFEEEWGKLYNRHFYPCDTVKKPAQVLVGFEVALHSLYVNTLGLSAKEKYEYYKNDRARWYDYIQMDSRREIDSFINGVLSFSNYVKQLRKYKWFAFNPGFRYFTPYAQETLPFFIEQFRNFQFDENYGNRARTKKEAFFLSSTYFLSKLESEEIDDLILERFEYFESYKSSAYSYKIAHDNENPKVIKFLLEQFYNGESIRDANIHAKNYYIDLIVGTKNQKQVRNFFLTKLDQIEKYNFIQTIELLRFFPEDEVINRLKSILNASDQISETEKLITNDVLRSLEHSLMTKKNNAND